MSIMRGGVMRGSIMRGGIMRGGIMRSQQHPIVALFARLGASGVFVDPLDHNTVWADTAGTLHPAIGAPMARLDAGVHSPVAAIFTNGVAAQQPILRADGLEFDGVDDRLVYADDPALRFGTTDFTIAAALKPNEVTQTKFILAKRLNSPAGASPGWALTKFGADIRFQYDYTGNVQTPERFVAPGVLSIGTWTDAIVQLNRAAGELTAYINNVAQTPITIAVGDISGTEALRMGSTPLPSLFFNGTLGRALAIDKLLSAADRTIVNDWLNAGHA